MPESPESHTIRLLQEMRQDIRELRTEMSEMREEMNGKFDAQTHMIMMLARNAYNHEERIAALEGETS